MKPNLLILLLASLFSTGLYAYSEASYEKNSPDTVLFVGNSFSYFNNGVHRHYLNLLKASGNWRPGVHRSRLLTLSGGRLSEHSAGIKALINRENGKAWDIVVLQEHSTGAIGSNYQQFLLPAITRLLPEIRGIGAEPVLFMTWAYGNKPEMLNAIIAGYERVAKQHLLRIAPVGLAFAKTARHYPDISLFTADIVGFDDGQAIFSNNLKHPSMAGTYLAACVFYSLLQQTSPQGLDYNPGLSTEHITKLQNIAWSTVESYRQVGKTGSENEPE
ncbi:hypothetical protein [Thalassotalea mangrovi]|uniref:SGNH/GDSL hydrolase family protein n=1 Tax=Thalassotalea mangrovi TaxID=2572245 RepID=A0A4U1B599_9GAMM|nr:hypothetical protein [Thalassotalea mangrovi]TKB45593.1 hypothetical protein E8M12_08330 [Thalassotalea mangrovi]